MRIRWSKVNKPLYFEKSLAVIKKINIKKMSEEEKKETFREAKILEVLNHPNIIRFKEVYKTKKGQLCIVMDYADGGDLAMEIKKQASSGAHFPEEKILNWFTQICLAIKHIHDRKILHRDLKSQNIFLTKQGIVKLGDFGIAKVLQSTVEHAQTIVGTPYYLSPEIIENAPYNFKSDMWSLGVLLYEMCALKPPFGGNSLHILALQIVRGIFQPIAPSFSLGMKSVVQSLLVKDTTKRPNINQVLKMPLIAKRIEMYLSDEEFKNEFAHTILHKQNIFNRTQNQLLQSQQRREQQTSQEPVSKPKPTAAPKQPASTQQPSRVSTTSSQKPQVSAAAQASSAAYQSKLQKQKEQQEQQRLQMLQELQRRKDEDERKKLLEREQKLLKEREINEERKAQKNQRDEERKKMKEDILNKKKDAMKNGGGIKVELVVPSFMKIDAEQQDSIAVKSTAAISQKRPEVSQPESFVVMAPPVRKQWGQRNVGQPEQPKKKLDGDGFEILISERDLDKIQKRKEQEEQRLLVDLNYLDKEMIDQITNSHYLSFLSTPSLPKSTVAVGGALFRESSGQTFVML